MDGLADVYARGIRIGITEHNLDPRVRGSDLVELFLDRADPVAQPFGPSAMLRLESAFLLAGDLLRRSLTSGTFVDRFRLSFLKVIVVTTVELGDRTALHLDDPIRNAPDQVSVVRDQ